MINKSVHTTDGIDIGDIEAVSRDIVVVKRGFVHIHYYYIPVANVEGWDDVLWLKITESEVKGNMRGIILLSLHFTMLRTIHITQ